MRTSFIKIIYENYYASHRVLFEIILAVIGTNFQCGGGDRGGGGGEIYDKYSI